MTVFPPFFAPWRLCDFASKEPPELLLTHSLRGSIISARAKEGTLSADPVDSSIRYTPAIGCDHPRSPTPIAGSDRVSRRQGTGASGHGYRGPDWQAP